MVFKNFRLQIIIRVLLLTAGIILLAWCLMEQLYLRSIYLAGGIIFLLGEMIWYVDRFNRDVKMFMVSLMQRDFTTYYQATGRGKSFDALYEMLNKISAAFKTISAEKETQHRYLEMLVEHMQVGVLSIDVDEKVDMANQALKDLLHIRVITNINSFESLDPSFIRAIREIVTGETRLVKLKVGNDLLQLSIHASEFKLQGKYYKLVSMQNIRTELDAREMDAWQKLIRVLSHEIMNSVSPISSLSETLHGLVTRNSASLEQSEGNLYESLDKGLEAIKIRSEGLYNFTQTYRKLTGIPQLSLKFVNLKDVVGRVEILMQSKLESNNVQLRVSEVDEGIHVDPELIEQVLINLVLNSIEAVAGKDNPGIDIWSSHDLKGRLCVHVADNGEGMDEQTSEKIFIPFFTTRKQGSGIGLALTKQILQLHHADIQFNTERGKGTEFVIVF
jgi:two-component system, NtrC family, nitrogen regulation sensor histidine kinase NtrY